MRHSHLISTGRCLLFAALVMFLLNVTGAAVIEAAAADRSESILTVKAQQSSRDAIGALTRHFGEIDHLFYLYSATEKDDLTVALSFPGRLLVAPDQTKLEALLSTAHPAVTITADPEAAIAFFQNASAPVAKVVNDHNEIVGIIATKADMEPLRTGAVVRHGGKAGDHKGAPATPQPEHAEATHDKADSHDAVAKTAPQSGAEHDEGHDTGHTAQPQHATKDDANQAPEPAAAVHETEKPATATHQNDHSAAPAHTAASATAGHGNSPQKAQDHAAPGAGDAHGTGEAAPGGHDAVHSGPDPSLPTGVAFMDAAIAPMDNELESRFYGWRPNDLIRFMDNVEHFQLGVLEITRRTAMVMAERISRTGTTASFDPDLENAMNWFMIKANRYWFPSAEGKYSEALEGFRSYRERLIKGEADFHTRADNLIPLLMAYNDLLGSCEENLVKLQEDDGQPVGFFKSDDYFFYAQGVISALQGLLEAIGVDFKEIIASRRAEADLHHAVSSCHHALEINPLIVFNNHPSGILANHRANLAAPVSHVRFYIGVMIKTLST